MIIIFYRMYDFIYILYFFLYGRKREEEEEEEDISTAHSLTMLSAFFSDISLSEIVIPTSPWGVVGEGGGRNSILVKHKSVLKVIACPVPSASESPALSRESSLPTIGFLRRWRTFHRIDFESRGTEITGKHPSPWVLGWEYG